MSSTQGQALRDFLLAVILLGTALLFAFGSEAAVRESDALLGIVFSLAALLLAAATAVTLVPRIAARVDFNRLFMPFSFNITREGAIYIVSVFLLSLAAINTGNNLLFLILAMLLAAIVTSGVFARLSLSLVSVSLQVPDRVFEGEQVALKVSVVNRKRIVPSFSICVEGVGHAEPHSGWRDRMKRLLLRRKASYHSSSVLMHTAYFPFIPPSETRSELVSQSFPRRGRYRLVGYRISTRFPFGFFQRGERVRAASGEVLVYPSIREVSSYFHLLPFLPGTLEGVHVGHGESLHSIRKYQDGESARIVDWKATAKTAVLMAREYAREEESKFCLILDTIVHEPVHPEFREEFEKAVSFAASLAGHFCAEGAEVEFATDREYIPRAAGTDQLYRILGSLAVVECRTESAGVSSDLRGELSGIMEPAQLQEILSEKVFKIVVTSKPKGSFPSTIWRSSHVVYFSEL